MLSRQSVNLSLVKLWLVFHYYDKLLIIYLKDRDRLTSSDLFVSHPLGEDFSQPLTMIFYSNFIVINRYYFSHLSDSIVLY